jgi:two-component system alkaline phosphatase synthesis response regulator PhoP
MAQKRILVVDDEVILVEFIKMRLEANGYGVTTAYDGMDGLLKAEEVRPDLIILDISMARMDGYTMLKRIRQNEKIKDTRVIMLTASGKKKEIFEAEGISDYIVKPFDTEDFLSRVEKVLGKGNQ